MEITVNKKELTTAILNIKKVLSNNDYVGIFNINNTLMIGTSNMYIKLDAEINADNFERFVNITNLGEVVKNQPNGTIEIEIDEDVTIGGLTLANDKYANFEPLDVDRNDAHKLNIEIDIMRDNFKKLSPFMPNKHRDLELHGVLIDNTNMVATNAKALLKIECANNINEEFIVPKLNVKQIAGVKFNSDATIHIVEDNMIISDGNIVYICSRVNATYINYNRILNLSYNVEDNMSIDEIENELITNDDFTFDGVKYDGRLIKALIKNITGNVEILSSISYSLNMLIIRTDDYEFVMTSK